jgi:large subunit ribosomal protein L32
MAVPKRKTSKARRNKRRAHLHLTAPNLVECPVCHSWDRPHRVCSVCGTYNKVEVIQDQE